MKTIFITLDGAKHKIKCEVEDDFIDRLNKKNKFISVIKRKRYCIINSARIVEINELPLINPLKANLIT